MTFQVKLSDDEVRAIIASHLAEKLNLPVTAEDLTSESYSCAVVLGKYDSFQVPPKPKKVSTPVPVAPVEKVEEVVAAEEKPF